MADETEFSILKVEKNTPMIAGCKACGVKFFTPTAMKGDPVCAKNYLLNKYEHHDCPTKTKAYPWEF